MGRGLFVYQRVPPPLRCLRSLCCPFSLLSALHRHAGPGYYAQELAANSKDMLVAYLQGSEGSSLKRVRIRCWFKADSGRRLQSIKHTSTAASTTSTTLCTILHIYSNPSYQNHDHKRSRRRYARGSKSEYQVNPGDLTSEHSISLPGSDHHTTRTDQGISGPLRQNPTLQSSRRPRKDIVDVQINCRRPKSIRTVTTGGFHDGDE